MHVRLCVHMCVCECMVCVHMYVCVFLTWLHFLIWFLFSFIYYLIFLSWSDLAVGRYLPYLYFQPRKKKAREISGEPEIRVFCFV